MVNAVYISDLAIKFELIANNASFIFTNVSTDPFNPTPNYSNQNSQNAFDDFNTDNSLPYSNHDAHTLQAKTTTTGNISSGGIVGLGVICNYFNKARGWTVSDEIIVSVDSLKGSFNNFSKHRYLLGSGSSQNVTLSVNNTNVLSPNIDILISANKENSFSILSSNTSNDGFETIIVSTALTSRGRIKIVRKNSSTAEFYDISNVNFSIVTACPTSNVAFLSNEKGVWSDLTVWNFGSIATNRLPNITDIVKINTGHIITLDVNAFIKILDLVGRLNVNAGRVLSY